MKESPHSDPEDFERELEILRSIIRNNVQRLHQDPVLDKQLDFWMESARFLMAEMKIWGETGNEPKHDQAVARMQKVLAALQELIDRLNDEGEGAT